MPTYSRHELAALSAFSVICRRTSFRLAATELGVTTSALSHSLRGLEEKLGVRLLNRTTRAVSPTAAGSILVRGLDLGFAQIDSALAELSHFRSTPAGLIRINVPRDAYQLLIRPFLGAYLARFPDSQVEVVVDDHMVDVVKGGFDAGIRYGLLVPQDMVGVALTPDLEWVLAASPEYLHKHGTPQIPTDLLQHSCIRMRIGDESIYQWELGRGAQACRIDAPGRLILNGTEAMIDAALDHVGIAYFLRRRIEPYLDTKQLVIVMPDWAPPADPLVMYYPSRRQLSASLAQLIQMIRQHNGLPDVIR